MGDEYLLPSIAVVVVGGTLITGGRGHYLGMLGGVLLLTALQTLLAGTTLPYAPCATSSSGSSCWARSWRCASGPAERGDGPAMAELRGGSAGGSWSRRAPPASAGRSPTRWSRRGARVHICDVAEAALADCAQAHPGVGVTPADVADEADGRPAVRRGRRRELGGLDVLVNNAGIAGPTGGVEDIDPADWRRCHRHRPHRPVPLRAPRRAAAEGRRRRRRSSTCPRPPAGSATRSARPTRPPSGASSA